MSIPVLTHSINKAVWMRVVYLMLHHTKVWICQWSVNVYMCSVTVYVYVVSRIRHVCVWVPKVLQHISANPPIEFVSFPNLLHHNIRPEIDWQTYIEYEMVSMMYLSYCQTSYKRNMYSRQRYVVGWDGFRWQWWRWWWRHDTSPNAQIVGDGNGDGYKDGYGDGVNNKSKRSPVVWDG